MSLSPISSYVQLLPAASAPADAARGAPAVALRSNPPAAAVAPQAKVAPTTSISPNTQSVKDAALNKAVDAINPVHEAQLLTYLRISQLKVGLLINFNCETLKDGIHRRVL